MQFNQLYSKYYTQIEVQQLYKNLKLFGFNKVELYSDGNIVIKYLLLDEGLMKIFDNYVQPTVPQPAFDVQNKSMFNESGLEIFASRNYSRGKADIIEHIIYKEDLIQERQTYDHNWDTLHGVICEKSIYVYDANNRLISDTKTKIYSTSAFAINDDGIFISEKSPESNTTTVEVKRYEYKDSTVYKIDESGNSIAIYNELKTPTKWSLEFLDKNNKPEAIRTIVIDDSGKITHIKQDILARPKDNKEEVFVYDTNGNLVERHRNVSKLKFKEEFVYENNLLTKVISYVDDSYNSTLEYKYSLSE